MSTLNDVLGFSRVQAQTDSNGLVDSDGIIYANEAISDFRRRLTTAGVNAAQLQESYETIVGGVGTYLYPTNLAWMKAIELNYADATPQNYVSAERVDESNLPGNTSFSWLRLNAQAQRPYFSDKGDWFEIFPTPMNSNAAGIRIWYFLKPTEFTSVNDNISYPESLDYRILGWRVAASFYKTLNKFDEAMFFDKEYEGRVTQFIQTLGPGTQQPLEAKAIQETGWNF